MNIREPRTSGHGAAAQPCDLMIVNGHVVCMDDARSIYPDGAVAVKGARILAVGPTEQLKARFAASRVIDAGGGVVHPGYIDAHTHITNHASRGLVSDDPEKVAGFGFGDWIRLSDEEDEFAQVQATAVEMLRHGYTCVMDPGTVIEPDAGAEALASLGVRGVISDAFLWDVPDGGNQLVASVGGRVPCDLKSALSKLGGQLRRNREKDQLIHGGIAIYGSGSQSEELMRAATQKAAQAGVAMTMHNNFTPEQTARDDARFGGKHNIVAYAEKGLLNRHCSFTHMNVIRDDEVDVILQSGMSLISQPGNYLFYGIAAKVTNRMPEILSRGGNVVYCVDVPKIWTYGTLELIGYLVARMQGRYISPEQILWTRTRGGARAVGLESEIGSLEQGKRADIVVRDANAVESVPSLNPVQEHILAAQADTVARVIVNGVEVFDGAGSRLVDMADVSRRARESAVKIMKRAGYTPR